MQFLFHLKLLTAWQAHKFLDYLIEKNGVEKICIKKRPPLPKDVSELLIIFLLQERNQHTSSNSRSNYA